MGKYFYIILSMLLPALLLAQEPKPRLDDHIAFTENKGQWPEPVLFKLQTNAGDIYFEKGQLTFNLFDVEARDDFFSQKHSHDHQEEHGHNVPEKMSMHAFKSVFLNANEDHNIYGQYELQGKQNYFTGNDPAKWVSNVRSFKMVTLENLYPGMDLHYYQKDGHLKYDIYVAPGADISTISYQYKGVEGVSLQNEKLKITTSVNGLYESIPEAYQVINGEKRQVDCQFQLKDGIISFKFPNGFDTTKQLIIDPQLIFASYTGSSADNWGYTATYDIHGNLYGGGTVFGVGYPSSTGAYQTSFAGGTGGYGCDIGISKFSSDGTTLVYSTYLGGTSNEFPHSLYVNDSGQLFIYGTTSSSNFPVSSNAYDKTHNGGTTIQLTAIQVTGGSDIFVAKLDSSGNNLLASTFIGGTANDGFNYGSWLLYNYADHIRGEIIVDDSGDVFVASSTYSGNFPTTTGAFQTSIGGNQDGVVFKFNSTLSSLLWSSFLGGSSADAAFSLKVRDGWVYVVGGTVSTNFPGSSGTYLTSYQGGNADGYIAKIKDDGSQLSKSTYIGTSSFDVTHLIEADSASLYIVGNTDGNYPVTSGVYSNANSGQYITKIDTNLTSIDFHTVFGKGDGGPDISPTALLVDDCGNIYVAGWGGTTNVTSIFNDTDNSKATDNNIFGMPVTSGAFKSTTDGSDFYFIILTNDASSLKYATYFGGTTSADHVDGGTSRFDKKGIVYHAVCASCGSSNSDFPVTPNAYATTDNSTNCNLGVFKFAFDLQVDAKADADPSTVGCAPFTVNFDNQSTSSVHFIWDFGTDTTSLDSLPTYTYDSAGVYLVTLIAIDSSTCNVRDTTYLTIIVKSDTTVADFNMVETKNCDSLHVDLINSSTNASTYKWYFENGDSATSKDTAYTFYSPGTYDITLIAYDTSTCNSSDTIVKSVTLLPELKVNIIADTLGCVPHVSSFNLSGYSDSLVLWDFGDGDSSMIVSPSHTYNSTGTYQVMVQAVDSNTCNIIDTAFKKIQVVNLQVTAGFSFTETSNCDSMVVDLTNSSTHGHDYFWNFGDGTTSNLENPSHTYYAPDTFVIMLVVFDSTTCNIYDTIQKEVILLDRVVAVADSAYACFGEPMFMKNTSINASSMEWHFGDGGKSAQQYPTHLYADTGQYQLMLIASNPNSCNLEDTSFAAATVYAPPIADFEIDPDTAGLGEEILFLNKSKGAQDYFWTFGNGMSSTAKSPIESYIINQQYEVCLRVENDYGCLDTACYMLLVENTARIFIPTAFSPNDDGKNDRYLITGKGIQEFNLKIFNRWGEMVYESNDIDEGWNGEYSNVPQGIAVFIYHCEVVFINGDRRRFKGNLTLIR